MWSGQSYDLNTRDDGTKAGTVYTASPTFASKLKELNVGGRFLSSTHYKTGKNSFKLELVSKVAQGGSCSQTGQVFESTYELSNKADYGIPSFNDVVITVDTASNKVSFNRSEFKWAGHERDLNINNGDKGTTAGTQYQATQIYAQKLIDAKIGDRYGNSPHHGSANNRFDMYLKSKKNLSSGGSDNCGGGSGGGGTPSPPEIIYVNKYIDKYNDVDLKIDFEQILDYLNGAGLGNNNSDSDSSIYINSGGSNGNNNSNYISNYDSNYVSMTNVPDNGKISLSGDSWKPEFIVSYEGGIIRVPKPKDVTQAGQSDKTLSEFMNPKKEQSTVEVLMYRVTSMNELKDLTKDKSSLKSIFEKDSVGNYLKFNNILHSTLDGNGVSNYDNLVAKQQGAYLLATKYVDGTREGTLESRTTYTYTPIELINSIDLGYLPVENNIQTKVNDLFTVAGSNKNNHNMSNLKYKNDETEYESLKVPSSYNHITDATLLGSTNGGLTLLDGKLKEVSKVRSARNTTDLKVSDIVEFKEGFYLATNKGILYLDSKNGMMTDTAVKEPINDIELINETLYSLSDKELKTYFIIENELVPSNVKFDLSNVFSSQGKKAGRLDILGNIITVSSKDEGTDSEVVILSKD